MRAISFSVLLVCFLFSGALGLPEKGLWKEHFTHQLNSPQVSTPLPGLLTKTWDSGAHLFLLSVICATEDCNMNVDVEVEMRNPDGTFLSAVEFPFLPFNGVMSFFYLILIVTWLVLIIRYWKDLMRIQFCIGVVLILGLWEHLTLFAIYETLRKSGEVASSAVYFAELIACFKRTLARLLVLIACLGYGVTKPRLGTIWFRRCLAIGLLYFVLVTMEGMTRLSQPRFTTSYFRLATLLPLLCLDAGIMWWIFIYLARTLRETRMRRNLVKHRLYRDFSYVLLAVSIISVAFMVWSLGIFKYHPCIESWHLLWIDDAFWQFLFVVILTFIVVLWRPTGSNRQYAYSLLDIAIDEEVDEEDEDVLLDRLDQDGTELTKIRSRQLGESDDDAGDGKASVQSRNDELSPLHYAQGPIPATIVERALLGSVVVRCTTTNPPLRSITLHNNALMMSTRLVMKRLQSNCPTQRTSQRPPSTLPELPTFPSIESHWLGYTGISVTHVLPHHLLHGFIRPTVKYGGH
ncbi:hypothetical protein T265_08361 [Opisthorchis viverrini]|uniref:GOST seven transmembrane domain-containing protein n=1 Tax=Opisthorchis viverrini TaxID=6198 RepID=A0A074ZDZ3_OPIVI|nr:hypothetical protein T265_08361 [Opisthorchis viverrini]KER23862.1 hypothetical protein T265_08361 [Opisthorchis viverrini]